MIDSNYKIIVNKITNKKIQDICFKYNIGWVNHEDIKIVKYIDARYLFVDIDSKFLDASYVDEIYNNSKYDVIDADDFIKRYGEGEVPAKLENRVICKTICTQFLSTFNESIQEIYDIFNNHIIDIKYSTCTKSGSNVYHSALITITPKQIKENLKIG